MGRKFSSPQWQADQEKLRKLHDSPRFQAEVEHMRLIAEKLREAEVSPTPAPKQPKREPVGRKRSLTPEQVEKGIRILRKQPRMTVEAARTTLRAAGIKGSDSALYRLVVKPAYAPRS